MILLIDCSVYQGPNVDFAAFARAGVRGCYVECQQGNDAPNPLFAEQTAAARRAGLAVGVYHFAEILPDDGIHPDRDPLGQIDRAWEAAGGVPWQPGDLPPMLDCEDPPPERWAADGVSPSFVAQWIAAALGAMDARWQRAAGIYTYAPWWRAVQGAGLDASFAARRLWLAGYPVGGVLAKPPTMTVAPPPPWRSADLWQFTDKFIVDHEGPIDASVFIGDEPAWQVLLGSK